MKILIYSSQNEKAGQIFQKDFLAISEQIAEQCQVVFAGHHQKFEKEIRCCLAGESIVVFFATQNRDLDFLESTFKNISDVKLIIGIPDSGTSLAPCSTTCKDIEKTLLSRAYAMKPRLVVRHEEKSSLLPLTLQGIVKEISRNQGIYPQQ